MGFASGSVSFRRFAVVGQGPGAVDQELLDALAAHAIRPRDVGGSAEEVEYGWSGGRHVLDGAFTFENNVYADAMLFGLRIDTNRVPGDMKRAYQIIEEDAAAAGNPSGFISKLQKREVKDTVRRRLDDDMRSGRFRKSKLLPILWDIPAATLYTPASGDAQEKLMEIFERTFEGLTLVPLSAGTMASRMLEAHGKRRDYEDLRPTRFVFGPDGEHQHPEYPWVIKGPQPKDFLGNEFLLWLWYALETGDGVIDTELAGEISVLIDRTLDLDCAYGATGRDALRAGGATQMPEARDALRSGKVPRKAGMTLENRGSQFHFTFAAEQLSVASAKLPDIEDADSPRVVFEERISLLRDLCKALDALYATFLRTRTSGTWDSSVSAIRRWALQSAASTKPVAAVA